MSCNWAAPLPCAGKASYTDKGEALRVLHCISKRHKIERRTGRGGLEPYYCRDCDRWHLGTGHGR